MKIIITLLLLIVTINLGFSQSGSQIFTSSGTFTVPEGITSITIEVVGAGGDGGGNGSGGGGGGGYASGVYAVNPFDELPITIGIHGQGSVMGTTNAGSLISATGGENGTSVSNPNIGGGGAGGTGSGGTIANYSGGTGGGGYYTYFGGGGGGAAGADGNGSAGGNTIVWNGNNCLTPGGAGGLSGGAPGGDGGKGAGFTDNFCNITDPAVAGSAYGGGGGGANGNGGAASAGADGYCKVTYCVLDLTTTVNGDTISANASGLTYQWIDCGNGNIAIAEQTFQTFIATQSGSYAVIISDEFCGDTSACVDVVATGIGIIINSQNNITVYQNPFSDYIKIKDSNGASDYELTNSLGQTIWKGKHIEDENFSLLMSGMYFLKVRDESGMQQTKLMKQ